MCKKNDRVSSRIIACSINVSLHSVLAKTAWWVMSSNETKELSIFAPSPYRAILGTCGAMLIQSEKANLSF